MAPPPKPRDLARALLRSFGVTELDEVVDVEVRITAHAYPEVRVTRVVLDPELPRALETVLERFELVPADPVEGLR